MEPNYYFNRRKGPDPWVKFLKAASAIVWGVMLLILLIVDRAKPEVESFFRRTFRVTLPQNWENSFHDYAFWLSLLAFAFSLFALLINKQRHRRKTDKYSKSLITMLIFSFLVILFYLFKI